MWGREEEAGGGAELQESRDLRAQEPRGSAAGRGENEIRVREERVRWALSTL